VKSKRRCFKKVYLVICATLLSGCTFNFELTSQRTALENQVMGTYKELDDDLVLVTSVRSPGNAKALSTRQKRAIDARQNQEFNRDDLEELKNLEIVGETSRGTVALVPKEFTKKATSVKDKIKLAEIIIDEENADRKVVWQRIIETNVNLNEKNLPDIQSTYAKMQRDQTLPGQWFQNEEGIWQKKADK
jgi:hypothetical protein